MIRDSFAGCAFQWAAVRRPFCPDENYAVNALGGLCRLVYGLVVPIFAALAGVLYHASCCMVYAITHKTQELAQHRNALIRDALTCIPPLAAYEAFVFAFPGDASLEAVVNRYFSDEWSDIASA